MPPKRQNANNSPPAKRRQLSGDSGSVAASVKTNPRRVARKATDDPDAAYVDEPESESESETKSKKKVVKKEVASVAGSATGTRSIKLATGAVKKPKLTGAKARKAALQQSQHAKPSADDDDEPPPSPMENSGALKIEDIIQGNIISLYWPEELNGNVTIKPMTAVQQRGFEIITTKNLSGMKLHIKMRKFLIVAVFTKHFVTLPIYSNKFEIKKPNQFAEIADFSRQHLVSKKACKLRGASHYTLGISKGTWLFSKKIANTNWADMKDESVVDLARPISFQYNVTAQLLSKLVKPDDNKKVVWNWHNEAMKVGNVINPVIVPDRKPRDK